MSTKIYITGESSRAHTKRISTEIKLSSRKFELMMGSMRDRGHVEGGGEQRGNNSQRAVDVGGRWGGQMSVGYKKP